MIEKDKELCPRLIDFLVVVGKRNKTRQLTSDSNHAQSTVTYPEILRRYPIDEHKDFILPTDVTVFCQPEGCTSTGKCRSNVKRDPRFFVFMLTEKDSAKVRYGICLNFHQSLECRLHDNDKKSKGSDQMLHLTSLCFITHHPFVSIFHELLLLLKKLIDSCNHRASQSTGHKNIVWAVLTGNWSEEIPPLAMKEIKEIETWILMLLSSPVPVPGKTKVQLEVMPIDIIQTFEFSLPDHTRFTLIDFPLHIPFELLGIDMALRVLTAVMLEFKVVIQSRNYNAVSMCVLSFVAMLYPLEYMFPVIPLLPAYMASAEQLLLAPTPFIIGVPSSFFHHRKIRELPNDVILVDLDTNSLQVPDDLYIPEMPEPDGTELKIKIKAALNSMSSTVCETRRTSIEAAYAVDIDTVDVACRVAMVQFFNSPNVFGNFSEHTRTLRLYPRPVVSLQTDSFLRSRPQCTQFITDLCRTQAVEYFAECSLCPKNETFVRVQAGIESATQVGDKSKWFSESLMPVHFQVYPNDSTLASAYFEYFRETDTDSEDEEDNSLHSFSSIDEIMFDSSNETSAEEQSEVTKPLAEVNDVYREPTELELPISESAVSISSTLSSGRSSPSSTISTSAMDSEADFARLAENLALKSNSQGSFSFDHANDSDYETTPVSLRRQTIHSSFVDKTDRSQNNNNVRAKGFASFSDSGEKMLGPTFMNAINGYAEKSQNVFSSVLNKTAPKAQALKEKTMKPIANKIEQSQHMVMSKAIPKPTSEQTANFQSKNQQMVKEFCDQALNGQSVGMFSAPKLRRLMDDESLRDLVCSKLNLGLETKLSEDEYVKEIQLSKAQFKAYVKILRACLEGIEVSFNTPGCCGLASVFHVLEIAHTHYWCITGNDSVMTPSSTATSTMVTPSERPNDKDEITKLPASIIDLRTPNKPLGQTSNGVNDEEVAKQLEESLKEKQAEEKVSPRNPPPVPKRSVSGSKAERVPPPLPPRPKNSTAATNTTTTTTITTQEATTENKPVKIDEKAIEKTEDTKGRRLSKEPLKPNSLPVGKSEPQKIMPTPSEPTRHYIYQELIKNQNPIWQNPIFWENAFVDLVAQEREIVGMDQEPSEMIDRYTTLNDSEKKRLELEEDRLLSTLLHNMTAYMVMCGTGHKALQQKVRRLLGKAHIGLVCSKEINKLLDELPTVQGNLVPLKPLGSRLVQKHSFTVYPESNQEAQMMFIEVCDDAVVLRNITGAAIERWWYERLVNMTYSPKTKVLCIWRRCDDKVHMHKFHTKKCRELYQCLKSAMERAASRGKVSIEGRALGGEFPIHDTETNQGGLLQVRCDGVAVIFANSKTFIDLANIKKCNTFGGNVFLLEEFDRKKASLVQRRYFSQMAVEIAWEMHRVFSVQFAIECQNRAKLTKKPLKVTPEMWTTDSSAEQRCENFKPTENKDSQGPHLTFVRPMLPKN